MENKTFESAVVTANENVNAVNNATASEVSMLAIATSGDKKKIHETFGRVDFSKDLTKIVKACTERISEFDGWAKNLGLLKAEADEAIVAEAAKASADLLKSIPLEDLQAEINRRSQLVE